MRRLGMGAMLATPIVALTQIAAATPNGTAISAATPNGTAISAATPNGTAISAATPPGAQYAQEGQYGGQPGAYPQPGQYPQGGPPPGQFGQQQGPGGGPDAQGSPADQLVGLFGATCLHFAGDVGGLRQFLSQQGAQELPAQASQAFLGSRPGKAYNASIPTLQLALLSLDDGGCEAVADQAEPGEVARVFQEAARENGLPLRAIGSSPGRAGTTINSYEATVGARQMHILITTGSTKPQAAIALVPR